MNKITTRNWAEYEKYQLWAGYHLKVPMKILEVHFSRSISAINKYLCRSEIRENINCLKNRANVAARISNLTELQQLFVYIGIDEKTVKAEISALGKWNLSPYSREKMCRLGMSKNRPWRSEPDDESQTLKNKIRLRSPSYSKKRVEASFQLCISYLNHHGITVIPIEKNNACGWTYMVDHKFVTDAGLLYAVNRIRLEKREPIFLLPEVTYEM